MSGCFKLSGDWIARQNTGQLRQTISRVLDGITDSVANCVAKFVQDVHPVSYYSAMSLVKKTHTRGASGGSRSEISKRLSDYFKRSIFLHKNEAKVPKIVAMSHRTESSSYNTPNDSKPRTSPNCQCWQYRKIIPRTSSDINDVVNDDHWSFGITKFLSLQNSLFSSQLTRSKKFV